MDRTETSSRPWGGTPHGRGGFFREDVVPVRKIVRIDEQKCDGCGQCIVNCPEGALKLVDGKARVVKESYCDGLGACIGTCPLDAITIEERQADPFDEEAVKRHMAESAGGQGIKHGIPEPEGQERIAPGLQCSCPGSAVRQIGRQPESGRVPTDSSSQLGHWPVQLTLVPPAAPFLQGADLLLAADCVPFALRDFHARFLHGRAVVVGCPKLDDPESYVGKLTAILEQSAIRSLTIIHMEVPCCTGLCQIARMAMAAADGKVPVREVTVSVDGRVLSDERWEGC